MSALAMAIQKSFIAWQIYRKKIIFLSGVLCYHIHDITDADIGKSKVFPNVI